ncbi:MAG: gliding motility-associated C-terminal domain-containing protein [Bacteroidota bacterium]
MKKLLILLISLVIISPRLYTQVEKNSDEYNKALQEAKAVNVPEQYVDQYVKDYFKRIKYKQEHQHEESPILSLEQRKKLPKNFYDEKTKTKYVNLTPQPMNSNCPNASFENLDFGGWVPTGTNVTGQIASSPPYGVATWTGGLNQGANNTIPPGVPGNNQTALMTTAPGNNNPGLGPIVGYDGIAINPTTGLADIPVVCPFGGGVSTRLGNDAYNYGTERLVYTMNVTTQNAQFTYFYAVVLQDPNHPNGIQPFFKVQFKDAAGVPLTGCGQYQVDASQAAGDPTFTQIQYQFETLYYKTWTTVGVDLSAWIGQTITIEFWTADCGYGGHFGYAYIDATCNIIQGTVNGFCTGNPTVALVAPTGFVAYEWNGPNNLNPIPGGTDDTLLVTNPLLNDTFYVQMVNAAGCTTFLQTVIIPSTLQLQSISGTPTCPSDSAGTATAVATGGLISGYNYIWSSGPGPSGFIYDTIQNVVGLPADTVFLHVESGGCPPKDTFIVIGTTTDLTAVASSTISCFGGNTGSLSLSGTNGPGSPPYQYTITGPTNQSNSSSLTSYTFSALPAGTYTIGVSPSGGNCGYDTVVVVPQATVTTTNANDDICPGDTVTLNSSVSGFSHQWHAPNGAPISGATSQNYTASPAQFGIYSDTITSAQGCVSVYTINLTQTSYSASVTNVIDNPCYQDSVGSISVNSTGGNPSNYVYVWNGPNSYSSTGSTNDSLRSGQYTIYAFSGNCKDTLQVNVVEPPMPSDTLEILTTFCDGDTSAVLMAPDSFSTYQWYYNGIPIQGANDTSIFILNPGSTYMNYSVTYIVPPCKRRTTVVFRSVPGTLFTPDVTTNIFTPNNDGKNDLFHPYYNEVINTLSGGLLQQFIDYASAEYTIEIYNRWGQLVFESNDYSKQWNGKNTNGADCDDGTYFWIANYKSRCGDGQVTTQKGYVQLIRAN